MRAFKIFALLLLVCSLKVKAQNAMIDSLKNVVALHQNNEEECNSLNRLAIQLTRYDMKMAKYYSLTCSKLAARINYLAGLSGCYAQLVSIYYNAGMQDSAHYYLNKGKLLADNATGNSQSDIKVKLNYNSAAGLLYKTEGDFKAAMQYLLNGLALDSKLDQTKTNIESTAGQSLNVGNNYIRLGDYKSALNYHLKALKLFFTVKNQNGQAFCYQSIAADFTELGLYQQALPYAMQAKSLKTTLNDRRGLIAAGTGLAAIYSGLGKYNEALDQYNGALKVVQDMKLVADEVTILTEIGNTYVKMKKPQDASAYFTKARDIAVKSGDNAAVNNVNARLSFIQADYQAKKLLEAKLINALNASVKNGDKHQELENYEYLVKFYTGEKDFEKAFIYSEKYHAANDSVQNTTLSLQVKKLEGQFNVARKEQEIALLKKDEKISHANLEQQKTFKYSAIIIASLLVLVLVFASFRLRTIQKAKAIIEMDKMRTSIASDLHDDIGSRLTNIQFLTELLRQPVTAEDSKTDFINNIREELLASTEALDEIVWNMKTKPDDQGTLQVRMRRYAGEIFDNYDLDYKMNVEEGFADPLISHEKQRDIFLMFREILNNIRKHAFAKHVTIDLKTNKTRFCIEIKDDGKGFDPARINKTRNGLQNIKNRVEKWNGTLVMNATDGTFVSISIPLKNT